MKRPLVWLVVPVLTAVLCATAGNPVYAAAFMAAIFLVAALMSMLNHKERLYILKKKGIYTLLYASIFLITYLYALSETVLPSIDSLIKDDNSIQCMVTGTIDKVSVKDSKMTIIMSSCMAIPENGYDAENMKKKYDDKFGLVIYVYDITVKGDLYRFNSGDVISAQCKLQRITEPRNDGAFDAVTYYRTIGVLYKASIISVTEHKKADGLKAAINTLRQSLQDIYDSIADEQDSGILKAVITGERNDLDEDIYELYQKNGIAHILAISGLHISFIGMSLYRLLRRLFGGYYVPFVVSITTLALYSVLTGNGVSAKRAVIMCVINMGAGVLGRTYDVLSTMSLAAILLCIENVYVIYSASFLLSFGAIAGIALINPVIERYVTGRIDRYADRMDRKRESGKRMIFKWLVVLCGNIGTSISVTVMTLPVIMYQFYQFPVYSVLINIVVIPLMSLVMMCGLMAAVAGMLFPLAGEFLIGTVHYVFGLYTSLCSFAECLPGNIYISGRPDIKQCVIYYTILLIVVWLLMGYKKCTKYEGVIYKVMAAVLSVVMVVSVIGQTDNKMDNNTAVIKMYDVGQGECIYVKVCGLNMLFDGGSSDVNHVGDERIIPALKYSGVRSLDYVWISHPDTDHISGIEDILTGGEIKIKNIVFAERFKDSDYENYIRIRDLAVKNKINLIYTTKGDRFNYDNLTIICLHPDNQYEGEDINDLSAVYRLEYKEFSMLFTGDVEAGGERLMTESISEEYLKADILKVAHHGSKSSSCKEWLDGVSPDCAIISCGIHNIYGHPSEETLERLKSTNADLYVTKETGQITIVTDGYDMSVQCRLKTGKDE